MNTARRPWRLTAAVFTLASVLAVGAAVQVGRENERAAAARFDSISRRTADLVASRLQLYEFGLRGVRGALIGMGVDRFDRERFRQYSATRDVETEFPGSRGFGVIRRVATADEPAFVEAVRRDGLPDFAIRQLTPHDGDRYVIHYFAVAADIQRVVGLDVASERDRRHAAQLSMRSGEATITAPITLIQATGAPEGGFLVMLPIYRPDAAIATPVQREQALVGWAYTSLVIREVMAGVGERGDEVSLRLSDLSEPVAQTFLASADSEQAGAAGLARRISIPVFGRSWEAEVRATPRFVTELRQPDPLLVGGVGMTLAAVLAALSFVGAQSGRRAAQVRAEQARRAAMMHSASDAIMAQDLQGNITDWNPAAQRLFGHAAEHAIGAPAAALLLPAERHAEDAEMRSTVARGGALAPFDTTRRHRDGSLVEVSATVSAIIGASGACIGFSTAWRDISQARRAERSVRELNAELEAQVRERTARIESARLEMQTMLDTVPSLLGWWGRDLRCRVANRAYHEWFGLDRSGMTGAHKRELLGGALFDSDLPHIHAVLRGEAQTFERRFAGLNGNGHRQALVQYLPEVVGGEVCGFFAVVTDISEISESRERLAAALRENEALLGTIRTHAIVSVTDRDGCITDVNDSFCSISGYLRVELIGQTHRLIHSGTQASAFWSDIWRAVSAGRPWRGDVCNRAKDGSLYWIDSIIAPFVGADGEIEKYISIGTNITVRKQLETEVVQARERAEQSERFLYDIADHVPLRIAYVDAQQRFGFVNRAYCERFARTRTEIVGRTCAEMYGASLPGELVAHIEAALRGEARRFEFEDSVQGETRSFDTQFVPDQGPDGKVSGFYSVSADETERKADELRLLQTSALLNNVLESATEVAIIAVAIDGLIRVFNRGAERLLGYARDEVVGRATAFTFHDPEELRARAIELSARLGRQVRSSLVLVIPEVLGQPQEWNYLTKDSGRISVSLVVTAMRGADGELFGYLGVAHDVTQRRAGEASLRSAMHLAREANQAKSRFLANMSHEIRTPLNAVTGLTYLLGQTSLDAEQSGFVAKIKLASKSLLAVINDVLDLSKIEAGELSVEQAPFSLAGLLSDLSDVMSVHSQAKGIELVFELPRELPEAVVGDAVRLGQVLTNLLSNAIKFTERGGVRLRLLSLPAATGHAHLRFEVQDSGIGIAAEAQAGLFVPFAQADASTTRRFGGTGLGLSIVKRLVTLMGGQVGLSSTPGIGSEFWVEVGFALAAPQAVTPAAADPLRSRLDGVRVLVVDDSEINLEVARRILELAGAQVTQDRNGAQAVARLGAQPNAFDVVLMDVQMPMLDGYDATRRIRAVPGLRALPIIALTAGALTGEQHEASAAGMDDFISKPFEPQHLIRTVLRHVHPGAPAASVSAPAAELAAPAAELAAPAAKLSAPAAPGPDAAAGAQPWPTIEGIDTHDVRTRLGGDVALFRSLLKRLLAEFGAIDPAPALEDPHALAAQAGRMHKLRGSAGMLGARAVQHAAAEAEAASRAGDARLAGPMVARTGELLRYIERRLPPGFLVIHEAHDDDGAAAVAPLQPGELRGLLELLRQQSLEAVERFRVLTPTLRRQLGATAFAQLREQVDGLQFDAAALALQRLCDAPDAQVVHVIPA